MDIGATPTQLTLSPKGLDGNSLPAAKGALEVCKKVEAFHNELLVVSDSQVIITSGEYGSPYTDCSWVREEGEKGFDWKVMMTKMDGYYEKVVWEFSHELAHVYVETPTGLLPIESYCFAVALHTMQELHKAWDNYGPIVKYQWREGLAGYSAHYTDDPDGSVGCTCQRVQLRNGMRIYEYIQAGNSSWSAMRMLCTGVADGDFVARCAALRPSLTVADY